MTLPWVRQEQREILPKGLKERMRDDDEIFAFDQWRTGEGRQQHPNLILPESETRLDKRSCRWVETQSHDDLLDVLQNQQGVESDAQLRSCSWEDVMAAIDIAKTKYATKADRNKGRAFMRNRPAMKTIHGLCNVIPEENGLSVLRGGLMLTFKLIERRIENQEKILRALEDVPLQFERACGDLVSFHYDQLLMQRIRGLVDTLLAEIAILLRILLREPQKKSNYIMGKVAKLKHYHPEHEAVEIENALFRIKGASDSVEVRTRFLRDQKISDIDETTRVIPRTIEQGFLTFKEQADQYFSNMALAFDRTISEATRQKTEEALMLQTGIYHMLEEYLYRPSPSTPYLLCATSFDWQDSISPMGSPGLPISRFIEMGLEHMFAAVGIHPSPSPGQPGPNISHIADDLELVLRHTYETEESALSRVNYLMRDPRFLSWLDTDVNCVQSDMLLINGYFENHSGRCISPLSVFSAFLVSGVIAQSPGSRDHVVLHHFCTLHTDPRQDELAGPRGLLRRLIAQILTHLVRLNVHGLLLDREMLHDGGAEGGHELNALCELFGRLLEEVPEGVAVFVIIDNVSDFETSLYGWKEEMDFVVGRIRGAGRPRGSGEGHGLAPNLKANVKVMMTCGMKSVEIYRRLDPGKCISLEAENE